MVRHCLNPTEHPSPIRNRRRRCDGCSTRTRSPPLPADLLGPPQERGRDGGALPRHRRRRRSDRAVRPCSSWRPPKGSAATVEDLCRESAVRTSPAARPARGAAAVPQPGSDRHDQAIIGCCRPSSSALIRARGPDPRNVGVEFLESRLDDVGRFGELATALRQRGFLVVLDDVGAGHSNLDRIPLCAPTSSRSIAA